MFKTILGFFFISQIWSCPNERYCSQCDISTNQCLACDYQVLKNGRCHKSSREIPHCTQYEITNHETDEVQCLFCEIGFGLDSDNKCVPCEIKDCGFCENSKGCLACKNGKKLKEKGENLMCTDEDSQVENCELSLIDEEQNICLLCRDGFVSAPMSESNPKACIPSPNKECMALFDEKNNKKCNICKQGFYLDNNLFCLSNDNHAFVAWPFFLIVLIFGCLAIFVGIKKVKPHFLAGNYLRV